MARKKLFGAALAAHEKKLAKKGSKKGAKKGAKKGGRKKLFGAALAAHQKKIARKGSKKGAKKGSKGLEARVSKCEREIASTQRLAAHTHTRVNGLERTVSRVAQLAGGMRAVGRLPASRATIRQLGAG